MPSSSVKVRQALAPGTFYRVRVPVVVVVVGCDLDFRFKCPGAYSDAPGPVLFAWGVFCMMWPGVFLTVLLCAHAAVPAIIRTPALAIAKKLEDIVGSLH
jgi:hypothetical protein